MKWLKGIPVETMNVCWQQRLYLWQRSQFKKKKKLIWKGSLFYHYKPNNVNFETGTINSKRELWPKNPKKTTKTVLKTKSVYTGTMFFFFRCRFCGCFKNGSDYEIYYEIFVQNIASKRKCWYWNNDFFLGSIFKLFKKC